MNSCSFIGRLGRDAQVRNTSSTPVLSFALAVDTGYGDNKKTLWLDCSFWGERGAKLVDYIKKGERLGVTGELGEREHDGKKYLTLRVVDVTLLSSRSAGESDRPQRSARPPSNEPSGPGGARDEDEIPFAPRGKRNHWE